MPVSVVDLLEGEDVMTLNLTEKALSVQCGGFSRSCPILDPDEFAISPGVDGEIPVEILPGALEQLLGIVRFLSNDDSRVIDALQIKASQRVGNYPDVSELLNAAQSAKVTGQVEFRAFQKSVERTPKACSMRRIAKAPTPS